MISQQTSNTTADKQFSWFFQPPVRRSSSSWCATFMVVWMNTAWHRITGGSMISLSHPEWRGGSTIPSSADLGRQVSLSTADSRHHLLGLSILLGKVKSDLWFSLGHGGYLHLCLCPGYDLRCSLIERTNGMLSRTNTSGWTWTSAAGDFVQEWPFKKSSRLPGAVESSYEHSV